MFARSTLTNISSLPLGGGICPGASGSTMTLLTVNRQGPADGWSPTCAGPDGDAEVVAGVLAGVVGAFMSTPASRT